MYISKIYQWHCNCCVSYFFLHVSRFAVCVEVRTSATQCTYKILSVIFCRWATLLAFVLAKPSWQDRNIITTDLQRIPACWIEAIGNTVMSISWRCPHLGRQNSWVIALANHSWGVLRCAQRLMMYQSPSCGISSDSLPSSRVHQLWPQNNPFDG